MEKKENVRKNKNGELKKKVKNGECVAKQTNKLTKTAECEEEKN